MRVAVGGIYHESNTFFSQPMTLERFQECQLQYGDQVIEAWKETCSEMAGFLEGAKKFDFNAVPTLMAWGMPAGPVTSHAFELLVNELTDRLVAAGPLDGVLLSLHGALVSDDYLDGDGEILRRVRDAIGLDVPLIVTLDLHANITTEMTRWPNAIIGYDTYPHIDQVERGVEAAQVLSEIVRNGLRPHMALSRRPMLPHILAQSTECPPMANLIAEAHELERSPGVISVTIAAGFPYTDVPQAGFAVIAVAQSEEIARRTAEALANKAWDRRSEFARTLPQPVEAVRQALAQPQGLTLLVDIGDNVGAGTPGDGTVLLSELLRQDAQDALVLLCDRSAVMACMAVGVRSQVTLDVGGKTDRHHGAPVRVTGTVRSLHDGIFRNVGPMRDGVREDQGYTAVVDLGGVTLVLSERRMPMWNLQQLRAVGIEPTRLRITVVKGAIAYRAAYAPIAHLIIEVDTPGLAAADIRRFKYQKLERPIYPLDSL